MKWNVKGSTTEIYPPTPFCFKECLAFLERSDQEILHQIRDGFVYKLVKWNGELILLKIGSNEHCIQVECPTNNLSINSFEKAAAYVRYWFDLDQDLAGFYEMANQDKVLQEITQKYDGLRIIRIPDLFEALTWAIIGQQINLSFAYTLKKRFVEQFGESLTFEGQTYWLFPTFEKIAAIAIDDLRKLQFSTRKAEYIIGIARAMAAGELTKEALLQKRDREQIRKSLLALKGVGAWTADYVMMKCLHDLAAFPIADVGLQNALKEQLRLERKPTVEEMEEIALNWQGWQAYATFYLWRSLYE
ncbi:DNA-3-methyladenine glycosylase family protein [Oceanobacillus polygoni]|uniref:DNA-3-methyladenine glycosylase II n=1 Tax=Oceanobacillus polygoni TaxID=1235259 RepID=A0A9X1CCY7_9BACI|nr:DNA-3-methyladenine glycosylase 2 [Oceanobacillus polygoni]MBP2078491.1 DNA-3-methyladenine glycosylase II [Oceanobacillus polygoni]